ncbi:MAG: hypothetical protein KIS68_12245 [Bauldia sp.]|nr:hypothetical protein [Bauldia sp.]
MSAPEPKKPVTISEANHEVEPRDPRSDDRHGARPVPSTTGAAAHALLDDAAGRPKSETEEALDRATDEDTGKSD